MCCSSRIDGETREIFRDVYFSELCEFEEPPMIRGSKQRNRCVDSSQMG